jgi:hypothetical protein
VGHCIQALIAPRRVLEEARATFPMAVVCPLPQDFALVPITDALDDALLASAFGQVVDAAEEVVTPTIAAFASYLSRHGSVLWVSTDYFGGRGGQDAVMWTLEHEVLCLGDTPDDMSAWPDSPISLALRRLGVVAADGQDEFDTLGLGRHRSNEAWVEAHPPE